MKSNKEEAHNEHLREGSPVKPIDEEQTEEEKKLIAYRREKISLLAIAYYNLGSQLEFERQYKECIDSFRQAISVLENNFAPNYPLTIEFKKTLSKAIQKYQSHITWKGYNRTFTNLNEGFVSKRVLSSSSRPSSAKSSKTRSSQPYQGRNHSTKAKKRPYTAHTKEVVIHKNLDDSLSNPFGIPDEEEITISLEKQNKLENEYNTLSSNNTKRATQVMSILDKPKEDSQNNSVSPMFVPHSKRFRRPQSAKTAFMSQTGRFKNKSNSK